MHASSPGDERAPDAGQRYHAHEGHIGPRQCVAPVDVGREAQNSEKLEDAEEGVALRRAGSSFSGRCR